MRDLEVAVDEAIARLRRERYRMAEGPWERALAAFERRVDADTVEYLDRSDHDARKKLRQIRLLHLQNRLLGSYSQFLGVLESSIVEASGARRGAPARLLELASGSGELTVALARLGAQRGLPLELTGSDIVPEYVRDATERARRSGVRASFLELNAFDLGARLRPGDVDVGFIVQSMHHFTPGQLAMMIAQVGEAGARRFVGVDGRRSLRLLVGLPALCALSFDRYFLHDAFVSARRLYADAELELIASMAANGASVRVRRDGMFMSVLEVDYAK